MKPKRRAVWGSYSSPVRTNLRYPGYAGGIPPGSAPFTPQGQILTNYPDSWELDQGGPADWCDDIPDNGGGPVWWIGQGWEDGRSPIGPHGPWAHWHWARAVVVRATSLIVDPLVSDPFKVTRSGTVNEVGREQLDPREWIVDPQMLRPDGRIGRSTIRHSERLARSTFWREWVRDALWYGMGFIECSYTPDGTPVPGTMRVLPNHAMWWDDESRVWWLGDPHDVDGAYYFDSEGYAVGSSRRLVILRNPHSPVDANGHTRGVFDLNPSAFRIAAMVDEYLAQAFRSGVPNGYLKTQQPNITQPQADELKARWLASHGRRRSIAVLNQSTEFVPMTWSPVDANVQEMKRLAIADIAFAFGMAPEVLGVSLGMSGTYSNIRDWWRLHRDFALSPWMDQMGGVLTSLTPRGVTVSVNLDAHTRPELSDRVDIFAKAAAAGLDQRAMADLLDLPYHGEGEPLADA